MNDQQHAFWGTYIRQLADLLGLKDRDVVLERDPPTDVDAFAFIWCCSDAVNAHIYLSKEFLHQSAPERQRCVIAHELMHIHTTPYADQAKWMLEHLPTSDLVEALPSLVRTEVERLTDRLAYIVAPFLPLPGADDTFEHLHFSMPVDPLVSSRIPYVVPTETLNGADR